MRRCSNGSRAGGGAIKTDDATAAQLCTAERALDKRKAGSGKTREADWLISNNQNEKVRLPETQETNVYLKSVMMRVKKKLKSWMLYLCLQRERRKVMTSVGALALQIKHATC